MGVSMVSLTVHVAWWWWRQVTGSTQPSLRLFRNHHAVGQQRQPPPPEGVLVTGNLRVEAAESDGKGLKRREGPLEVHGELILGHPSELEEDTFLVFVGYKLEVLNGCHGHAPVEVEHKGSHLVIPARGLVDADDNVPVFAVLELGQHRLLAGHGLEGHSTTVLVDLGNTYLHAPWTTRAQHVRLVLDDAELVPRGNASFVFILGIRAVVIDLELCAYEISPQFPEVTVGSPPQVPLRHGDQVVGSFLARALLAGHEEHVAIAVPHLHVDLVLGEHLLRTSLVSLDVALDNTCFTRSGGHEEVPHIIGVLQV
mmetsp:Transcript_3327/g.9660  ORF Transcript_3327/g.9660 Transcript_3327/m.9660 type:complete len:312 (-) Transcript_3327:1534-2469(-)